MRTNSHEERRRAREITLVRKAARRAKYAAVAA